MIDEQLTQYIRKSQEIGLSWDTIKNDLLSAGWPVEQVDEAYRILNIPKPPTFTPPSPVPLPTNKSVKINHTSPFSKILMPVLVIALLILSQNIVVDILNKFAQGEDELARNFRNSKEYQDYNIEIDKLVVKYPYRTDYSDEGAYLAEFENYEEKLKLKNEKTQTLYNEYYDKYKKSSGRVRSISFKLILHALIVAPFWIITFLLYAFLKEDRKRYEVLLGAYYITSGWLLIALLFNVARYIWYSDTVLGVYIVLGMLVVVLTGAVWAIQKYRHSLEK